VRAVVRGTHTIAVFDDDPIRADIEAWSFELAVEVDGIESPRVTLVEAIDGGVLAHLDWAMRSGTSYTLTPPGAGEIQVLGPRRSLAVESSPLDRVLLDIDAPFIRPDRPGGDLTILESGDYALGSGVATVEKAIWDLLLSTRGSRYWNPAHGTELRHKQVRAVDVRDEQRRLEVAIEAIPYVRQAVVQLLWEGGHARVRVRAETDFGRLQTEGAAGAFVDGGVEG